jgi:FG-GAP-like repeat
MGQVNFKRTDFPADPANSGGQLDALVAADFNSDGKLDFAVVSSSADIVTIVLGNGDGTFQAPGAYSTGRGPSALVAADFNGDKRIDLAITNFYANSVSILLGKGDGTFQAKADYPTGATPVAIAVGDFNGDGVADLAVVNRDDSTVSILLGNGDGTFRAGVTFDSSVTVPAEPTGIIAADFNGDNVLDLAVCNNNNSVCVFQGNGDGTFQGANLNQVPAAASSNQSALSAIAAGDFNGDQKLDLAVAQFNGGEVWILIGNGDGTFEAPVGYSVGNGPVALASGDFDKDGVTDLAVVNLIDWTVSVLLGNGDGTFQTAINFATGLEPDDVVAGDFNGDGNLDLAVTNALDQTISVFLNAPLPAQHIPASILSHVVSYVNVLFGVINDGSGVGILPGGTIIHFPPGGPPDPVFRIVARGMAEMLMGLAAREAVAYSSDLAARQAISEAGTRMVKSALSQTLRSLDAAREVATGAEPRVSFRKAAQLD